MKNITLYDVAIARGVVESETGGINLGEFDRVGVPMFGGCEVCHASIAAYNGCPSLTGCIRCLNGCIEGKGFPSVEAYEAWLKYQEALEEAESHPTTDDE